MGKESKGIPQVALASADTDQVRSNYATKKVHHMGPAQAPTFKSPISPRLTQVWAVAVTARQERETREQALASGLLGMRANYLTRGTTRAYR